ncbi:Lrp/AsnC family transcriptional regulator [Actinomadura parmotrematis]|uniref:Lrp/AsnC family transcriptional regulator n=1 Tax=Actinomadura parmotrematis TaxID=2864039 RepID=A0ABS7G4S5_9ACTN|nr:Lrp/AsnC family transcriptional regulator [Actinomadura parmotrematis]MBW8487697.1 Lrp/AsnC family transcriptional regulator [Actinomadura parmotrematis]
MALSLDEIDRRLLTELQADADRTNVELARLVGLSPAATLHRVRRLKEAGVIRRITAELDPDLAGFPLRAYVSVTLARHTPTAERAFQAALQDIPQVVVAEVVAGETDLLIQIVARDVPELQRVLTRLSVHGAQRIVTLLHLQEIKTRSPLPLTDPA